MVINQHSTFSSYRHHSSFIGVRIRRFTHEAVQTIRYLTVPSKSIRPDLAWGRKRVTKRALGLGIKSSILLASGRHGHSFRTTFEIV